ncbi:hypothetical protein ACFL5Z_05295 [Planctomycetota bacterium]
MNQSNRQLFLKDSRVANFLNGIEPGEVVALQLGDFPALRDLWRRGEILFFRKRFTLGVSNMDIKTSELGHVFTYQELQNQCWAVWGGVAFPGKRPGFAVVVGMGKQKYFDSHDIYLLDEYESIDIRKLVRQCGALDRKYFISYTGYGRRGLQGQWIGDHKNGAASRFIEEMNNEFGRVYHDIDDYINSWHFSLCSTRLFKLERPYQHLLPQIKNQLNPEQRQLFLKDSKVTSYLADTEGSEMAELELGDYPAIEALGFAVAEMRDADVIEQQSKQYRLRNDNPQRKWPLFRRR